MEEAQEKCNNLFSFLTQSEDEADEPTLFAQIENEVEREVARKAKEIAAAQDDALVSPEATDAMGEPEHVEPLDLSAITAPSDVTPPGIETPRDLPTPVEPLTSRRSDAKSESSARSSGKKEKTVRFSEQVLVEEFVSEAYDDDVIDDVSPAYGAEDNYEDDFETEGGANGFSENLVSTLDLLNTDNGKR